MEKIISSSIGFKGRHVASVFDMRSTKAAELEREIEHHIRQPRSPGHREAYLQMVAELKRLFQVREYAVENLICAVGQTAVMRRLANDTAYTGIINYGALGSSSTPVADGDVQLGTEVFRKLQASTAYSSKNAFIDFFYSKADTNGTYNEFGTFIDGAAGANTGQLFTHALTGGWVKTALESMTVASQYTSSSI